jgi:hypothetical protein
MEMHITSKTYGTHIVYFDIEDFDKIKGYNWYIDKRGSNYYARAKSGESLIYMHRLISNAKLSEDVDHINGNGLNNFKSNLRPCSHIENSRNQCIRKNNTTGLKGVSFYKPSNKYRAYIVLNNKQLHLGYFDVAREAANAYDAAAIRYFGQFANTNNTEIKRMKSEFIPFYV